MARNVTELERPNDVPDKIGKYVIINKVGKGSTGIVYLSHDPYYRRDVAIKVYSAEEDQDEDRARVNRKMFFNEAHMVGMLQHPNIMPIYDAGEEDGQYYVVTEHVQGARTLAAYCRPDNLLRVDDVVEIIYKCAKALHYSHGRGVIHRDIKPSNVMLTIDNDVRIIDFGIAICADADVSRIEGIARFSELHVSRTGAVGGTHIGFRYLFSRCGTVRITDRFPAVPRRQPVEVATPDRVRNTTTDSHLSQRSFGRT